MALFKLTINDIKISNANILDRVEFVTDLGAEDFTVGKLIVPTAKIKLHEDVSIKTGDVVKIYIDDVQYFVGEPYEITSGIMSRDITLYAMPYFELTKTYTPTGEDYTTRSLLLEMQTNIGFTVANFDSLSVVDMKGVVADTGANLLQAISMLLGANVVINSNGEIEFISIGSSTVHEIAQSQITSITKADTIDYLITRIIGKRSDSDEEPIIVGTQANSYNDLSIINPYLTESICTSILGTLPNYTGFDLTIFDSPSFKPLDRVKFTYKGTEYTIPVMNLTLTFSVGGLVAKVQSCVSTAQDKTSNYKGSFTSKLEVLRNVQSELNTKIEVVDGRVSSLITRTDVIEDDIVTVHDQYTQIQQDLGNINLTVGEIVREEMTENMDELIGDSVEGLVDDKVNASLGDLTTKVETNTENISSLQINLDSVTTTVNEEVETINEDLYLLQTRVSSAEQKITKDAIVSTVSDSYVSKTDYNNMIIGGENMIVNSNFEYGLSGWTYANSADAERWSVTSDGTLKFFDNTTTENTSYQLFSETPINVSVIAGEEVTLSFEYKVMDTSVVGSSTIGYICFYTEEFKDSTSQTDAVGYYNFYVGNDYANGINNYTDGTWDRVERTVTVPQNAVYARVSAYCAIQGEIYWRKYQLEVGNKSTSWKASVQDAGLYASSLSNMLSTELGDLSEIVSLNNGSDAITPMMKVKLVSEANDAKSIYDNLFSMYQTVGVTDFSDLVTDMVNAHMKLTSSVETMQDTITETSETGLATILDNFNKFYATADILNQAIINALKGITNDLSTSITQLSESVDIQINSFNSELGAFKTNFSFGADGLTIKSSADATKYIKLDNDSLDFMDNGQKVAEITNQQLNITSAQINNDLKIGNMKIKPSGIGGVIFVFE